MGTRKLEKSFLAAGGRLADHDFQSVDDSGCVRDRNVLRYATPGKFKGLEADVVFLCDVDGSPLSCSSRNLYVAVSRARHRLYIFHKDTELAVRLLRAGSQIIATTLTPGTACKAHTQMPNVDAVVGG